jgi:hypothetical protein
MSDVATIIKAEQEQQAESEFARLLGKEFRPMGGSDEPFATPDQFVHVQRVAKAYAASALVPDEFRGKIADCAIVVALAWRHKADPLAFFQHVHVIHGRPGMDAQLAIALANNSGKIKGAITHEFERDAQGKALSCTASAVLAETGEVIRGSTITLAMAEAEGWARVHKDGSKSKWLTMPDHMFRFRSSAWLLREYLPEVLLGMYTTDELEDLDEPAVPAPAALTTLRERIRAKVEPSVAVAPPAAAGEKAPEPAPATLPPVGAEVPVPATATDLQTSASADPGTWPATATQPLRVDTRSDIEAPPPPIANPPAQNAPGGGISASVPVGDRDEAPAPQAEAPTASKPPTEAEQIIAQIHDTCDGSNISAAERIQVGLQACGKRIRASDFPRLPAEMLRRILQGCQALAAEKAKANR